MSNLVHLGSGDSGAIAVSQDGQPMAVVGDRAVPLTTREGFALAERLLQGLVPATQVNEAVELALSVERHSNRELMQAFQEVAETAIAGMAAANGSLVQQNQQLMAQNERLTDALIEKSAISDRSSSESRTSTTVIVERGWGYYCDPMPAVCLAFFATVVMLVAIAARGNQQPQPQPVYSAVQGVRNV